MPLGIALITAGRKAPARSVDASARAGRRRTFRLCTPTHRALRLEGASLAACRT